MRIRENHFSYLKNLIGNLQTLISHLQQTQQEIFSQENQNQIPLANKSASFSACHRIHPNGAATFFFRTIQRKRKENNESNAYDKICTNVCG